MDGKAFDLVQLVRAYLACQTEAGLATAILPAQSENDTHSPSSLEALEAVRGDLGECTRCALHASRTSIVFGEGHPFARLMFVGEAPGADEDREGRPFVGRAGRLLTKMIQAMGLDRDQVYIANVIKCRPPDNRDPEPAEIATCLPFLEGQIRAVNPEVIVTLGRIAASALLSRRESLGKIRGEFHYWKEIPVMPTYHPSYLLRQEPDRRPKAQAWSDLQKVMALLSLPVPPSGVKK
ncbi:MAG: uracil-DNA glycosylase [Thermodesulfobacteriota bacterium]